jgi:predicted nucleotidyltransferase
LSRFAAAVYNRIVDPRSAILERISKTLARHDNIELAAVFGSTARQERGTSSDVDIALLLTDGDTGARSALEADIGRAAGYEVDIVYLDKAPPHLRFEIAKDGLLLVERNPYGWADFCARAMLDWWDWQPWARAIHARIIERLQQGVGHGTS